MNISSLLIDLCAISLAGVLFGLIARALKLPTLVGYLFAGYFIGPHSPLKVTTISDPSRIHSFAELGIILLIFTVGLDLGFRRLKNLGIAPIAIGFFESLAIWYLATHAGIALGYSSGVSQFIGAAVAISSTTVVLATLTSNRMTTAKFSDILVGILLIEDLVAILMLVYLPAVAQAGDHINFFQVATQLVISIFAWWLGGSIIVPKIALVAQHFGGDELLLLASLGLCLGLALIAVSLNFSSALGAFVMGAILADSRQSRKIETLIKPLRQIFGILFFVSFGTLFNPQALVGNMYTFGIFLAILVVGKFALSFLAAIIAGQDIRDSLRVAAFLGVAGEFSFVIIEAAVAYQFLPQEIFPIVVAIAVASVVISPLLASVIGKYTENIVNIIPQKWQAWHKSYSNTVRAVHIFRSHSGLLRDLLKVTHLKWFLGKLAENYRDLTSSTTSATLNRLAPWDEYLSEIHVEHNSPCEGKSLEDLNPRTQFQVNIVGVEREMFSQIPPDPKLRLLPNDSLLVYGNEASIANFAKVCCSDVSEQRAQKWVTLQDCALRAIRINENHQYIGKTLRDLNLRSTKSVTVLAVVRGSDRIKNPAADLSLLAGDEVFVVGPSIALSNLPDF